MIPGDRTLDEALADAIMVLRCVSPNEMEAACRRQNYEPKGPLDGSLIDDLREARDFIQERAS